jgi:hypothetical protein
MPNLCIGFAVYRNYSEGKEIKNYPIPKINEGFTLNPYNETSRYFSSFFLKILA